MCNYQLILRYLTLGEVVVHAGGAGVAGRSRSMYTREFLLLRNLCFGKPKGITGKPETQI